MKKLTYFIEQPNGDYKAFYEYKVPQVGIDELYARQLCTYFIMKGQQYELICNEMNDDEELLILRDLGRNNAVIDERSYQGRGVHLEIRRFEEEKNYKLLTTISCSTHFDVMRYLLKDIVAVEGLGQMEVTSTEIDEDRSVYVLYVKAIEEE